MSTTKINNSEELVKEIQTKIKLHLDNINNENFHLTQEAIAEHLGISQSNVSRILNSHKTSLEKVIDLAIGIGVEINIKINSTIKRQQIKEFKSCIKSPKRKKNNKRYFKR